MMKEKNMKYSLSLLFLLTAAWCYLLGRKSLSDRFPSVENHGGGSVGLFV